MKIRAKLRLIGPIKMQCSQFQRCVYGPCQRLRLVVAAVEEANCATGSHKP